MLHSHNPHYFRKVFSFILCLPILAFSSMMGNYNDSKNTGSLYIYSAHDQHTTINAETIPTVVTETVTVTSPPIVVTPPTVLTPNTPSKYFAIDSIIFSAIGDVRTRYGVLVNGSYHGYIDFLTGVDSGFYFRVRDVTINNDDGQYNGTTTWSNGSFTGGNTRYSPGGYRVYGSNGSLIIQNINGKYASLKINVDNTYDLYSNDINNLKIWVETDKICFKTYHVSRGCVSYLMKFKAL